ncbi:FadR/GntR family transcriptional regulator [Desulfovibrio subterraneus]|jgi:GntR family transcriptional repressor for pyruvate dehydrogenase complex|uniref:FadR/GntR family transcriptional regulator n=1 Tax=Desulfovibrio subterraneus TaxID=2718620 RepID=UPI00157B6BCE|nr:GntR family transcriptional regulator [Desulfovibrio subterraneus]
MQKSASVVAEQVIELIHEIGIKPGGKLPGERPLADRFGCSRNTVREALAALSARGTVEIRTRSGAYLREGALTENAGGEAGIQEAFEALETLGPALVGRTCRMASDAEHERIERVTARLGRALVDRNPYEAWQGLMAFYNVLAGICGNALLSGAVADIAQAGRSCGALIAAPELMPDFLQHFFAEHVEMLQAMRQREIVRATGLAAASIEAFGTMLMGECKIRKPGPVDGPAEGPVGGPSHRPADRLADRVVGWRKGGPDDDA